MTTKWHADSNYLIVLSVDDLVGLQQALDNRGFKFTSVYEPDYSDQLTAIALPPGKYPIDHLPLALRDVSKQVKKLRSQLRWANENNHLRNLELDALHYVWCDGGCPRGVHRWTDEELTEEIVALAERNTQRLRQWFSSQRSRISLANGTPMK